MNSPATSSSDSLDRLGSAAPSSVNYYQAILHQLPHAFCVGEVLFEEHGMAVDYRLTEVNATFEQQTALRNAVGRTLRELASTPEAAWYERLGQVARTGQPAHFEQQTPFGGHYWYEVQALPTGPPGCHQVALLLTDSSARRQTEAALRSSQDRQAFLVRLGDELRPLVDTAQVEEVAARLLGQHLRANQVHYGETQGDDVVISQGYGNGLPAMTGRFHSVDFGERLTATHRAGIVQVVSDIETDAANTEAERQVLRQARIGAYITVPLLKQWQWVATLAVHSLTPRLWTVDEVRLVEDVAERTWAAVERARAEAALRESEAKYRAIFNSINEGFSLLDIQFDEQGEAEDIIIRDANPAQDRVDGVRALIGKRVREFLPNIELKWIQRYGHVAQSGESAHFEDWLEANQRWYEVDASRVGEEGSTLVAIVYNDITERKQAKIALEKAHERLQLAMTTGRIFSFEMNPVTRALELSDNVALVLGFPLPDHIDSTFELIHPDDLQPTVDLINGAINARSSYASEYRLVNPANGDVVWFHSQAAFTQYKANGEWRFVGIAQNITERKQAEEALQASEQRLRVAIEAADMGTWDWNLATDEVYWNDQHFALFGREPRPGPVSPEDFARQVHPADRGWVWQRLAAAVAQQHVFEAEFRIVRADDGETCWMSGYGQAMETGPAGDTRRMSGVLFDITPRKQAEEQLQEVMSSLEAQVMERTQALRDSQELLQLVFDASSMAISVQQAVRDAHGDIQDFRVLLLNKELARELGRSDMIGKHYVQEYPGMKGSGLFDLMRTTVETGEPQHMEYYYPFEGFNRWFACSFVKLNDGVVATNLDITPRKLAEEQSREQAHFIARVNETLPDLMTVTELPSGHVLYVNRDPDETPGFEREKLLNVPQQAQTALLRMHPDDAALLPDYFVRAAMLADHEIATYGYRAKLSTDHWHSFQVRGSVFQRDPATGAATQILSVAQDVTAQKEAERQQAKAYQLLQQSEEVASLGSWDYDRTTGEFQWSAGMYRLFELPMGSPIRPATYLDFAIPEDRPVAERIVRGLREGRTGFEETLRIQVGDAVKTVRVKAAVVTDAAGEPLRVLGVDLDISQVQRLEADNLRLRLTQQQALFEAVQQAQEAERKRIAEGLHNGVGQLLYATKLRLDLLHAPVLTAQPAQAAARQEADRLLAEAIRQTRVLSHELVPTALAEFGLTAALQDVCRQLSTPQLLLRCHVVLDEEVPPLSPLLQLALYRMAQELGLNIAKHARGATDASLDLETTPGFVLLRAEDNGAGFTSDPAASPGLGLRTIRDRVALLNGTLDIGHDAEFGTFVRLRIPLPAASTT